ncbi:hypothetical protein B0H17DRAFT_1203158 [Mycena rosella]|uniref:Uncharacterized protein n=1 Tax=Mycena rosella TaxID=1033263 RepID=A0AAD7DCP0_MYCRO|nr:hypothetical protein B0H17DRAFT_1203158 [Mycena rosella]
MPPHSLLALAPAFTLSEPTNPTSGAVTEIHWTFTDTDPATFDLFLMNSAQALSLVALLGTELETDLGQITALLPTLPAANLQGKTISSVPLTWRTSTWCWLSIAA